VTGAPEMLLLSDEATGRELVSRLDGAPLVRHTDPYDVLMAMGDRRWPVVILSAPQDDFEGLCRALRRLQREGRLLAICPPACEPQVRPLVGAVLDDYFIFPPTRSDAARIPRAASGPSPQAPPAAGLSPRQFSALVEAARSMASLEAAAADLLGRALDAELTWADPDQLPDQARPLLLAAGDSPRVLVPKTPLAPPEPAQEALLAAVQECMPALVAAARRTESLYRLAITDHLTGAYNRRYFYHVTDRILLRARRRNPRVTLLLWDIDNFKRYNDTYGYAAGDEILRETVAMMKRISRAHDIVARIGGEEFTVLFWDPDRPRSADSRPLEDAYALADRFRNAVATHAFPSLGPEAVGTLTISGGLASFPQDGQTCRELLRKADQALKAAKRSGKNAIRLIGRE